MVKKNNSAKSLIEQFYKKKKVKITTQRNKVITDSLWLRNIDVDYESKTITVTATLEL